MKVGIVGLGKMGSAIAARFRDRGFAVIGWDASARKLAQFESGGQRTVASAAEVVDVADCVVSIISDGAGVRDLFSGEAGFLSRPVEGKLFIEMSTVGPAVARELEPLVMSRGAAWVEAPVMGTVPRAREGSLVALAGGHEEAVERARPYLAAVTRRIEHVGPAGRGYAMKLCANLLMGSYLQALAEALALGTRSGIPLDLVLDILRESPVASPWLATKDSILREGTGDMSLDIASLRKDLMAAMAAGAEAGVPMPGAGGALAALSAAVAYGEGAKDLAEHAAFFRRHMLQEPLTPGASRRR